MLRVCRPGGRIGLACWTPQGFLGQLFKVVAQHVPPIPGVQSPLLWGTDAHIEELFAGAATIAHDAAALRVPLRSAEHLVDVFRTYYGPVHKAFAALDADAPGGARSRPAGAAAPHRPRRRGQPGHPGGVSGDGHHAMTTGRNGQAPMKENRHGRPTVHDRRRYIMSVRSVAKQFAGVGFAVIVAAGMSSARVAAQSDHSHQAQGKNDQSAALVKIVREATERFRDVSVAEAEGYALQFGCVSGPDSGAMGMHFVNGPWSATACSIRRGRRS